MRPNQRPWGTGTYDKDGYLRVQRGGKRVLVHREVMEQVLGRPLRDSENVHHINGVKSDNRPENLELWVTYQPSGQRPEDLVAWAHEIIETYGQLTGPEAPGSVHIIKDNRSKEEQHG